MTTSAPTETEQDSSVADELREAAIDLNSRMIVSCLLVGRMIAASDGIIAEEERAVFKGGIEGALHLAEPKLIDDLLQEATQDAYEMKADLESVVDLTGDFDRFACLHLFAFACEVSAADLDAFASELPILTSLATTLGVGVRERDALLSIYCEYDAGVSPDQQTLEELVDSLHPDRLPEFGVTVHEMALDQARKIEGLTNENLSSDEPEAPEVERARPDSEDVKTSNTVERSSAEEEPTISKIAASLGRSPTRKTVMKVSDEVQKFPMDILHDNHREEAERIRHRVDDDQFRISVVGAFSSGKSTLLNALCREAGRELFPTAMIPCTGAVTILRYGDEVQYWEREIGEGSEKPIDKDDFHELVELPEQMERVEHFGSADLDALVVDYPLTLCESGVEIVDSPGLNENPQRTRITEQYLKQSDAVIYVMTVQQLASLQDRKHIEELVERVGTENLFFVVNCFDKVAGTNDESKVIARARSFFEEVYDGSVDDWFDSRIHFLSALKVLNESGQGDVESRYLDDFAQFEEVVGTYLSEVKGENRWYRLGDELMEVLARTYGHAQSLVHEASSEVSDAEEKLEESREALRKFERGKQKIRKAEESAEYTIDRIGGEVLEDVNRSLAALFSELPDRLKKRAEKWESEANPLLGKKELQEDFSEQFQDDIAAEIERWKEQDAQPIIGEHFKEMIESLNKDFEEIQEQMNELRSLSDETFTPPEQDEDAGAFLTFVRGAAGWAAGGPLGAFVGATLDWEDVAMNAAANVTVGLALGFLGVASAGVLLPVVAAIGAIQAWLGADKVRNKLREKILEAGIERLPEIQKQVSSNINKELETTFDELAEQVSELVERELQEIEEQIKKKAALREECLEDSEKKKQKLVEVKEEVERIGEVASELEAAASLSFDDCVRRTGHTPGMAAAE